MGDALDYLLKREWSVGNGQCPACFGMNPVFLSYHEPSEIGHKPGCGHAAAIKALGGNPMMLGDCPPPPPDSWLALSKARWDAMCAKAQDNFDREFIKALLGDGTIERACDTSLDGT